MRKLIYLVAGSLDGMIARQDGSFDCFMQEGEHVHDYGGSVTGCYKLSRDREKV